MPGDGMMWGPPNRYFFSVLWPAAVAILILGCVTAWASEKPAPAISRQGPEIFVQMGHSGEVRSIAISPDNKFLLSGSDDKTIKLWNLATGREIRTFKGHQEGFSRWPFLRTEDMLSPVALKAISCSGTSEKALP